MRLLYLALIGTARTKRYSSRPGKYAVANISRLDMMLPNRFFVFHSRSLSSRLLKWWSCESNKGHVHITPGTLGTAYYHAKKHSTTLPVVQEQSQRDKRASRFQKVLDDLYWRRATAELRGGERLRQIYVVAVPNKADAVAVGNAPGEMSRVFCFFLQHGDTGKSYLTPRQKFHT